MSATENRLLGLMAETSIHAGTGQNTGIIDLPIQREGHTGWPCVYGSGLKGALRSRAEDQLGSDNPSVKLVFGPDTRNASEHAGALTVSDARLVLLPVRSLTSHFKWVSCPAALARLARDAGRAGIGGFEALAGVELPNDGAHASAAIQHQLSGELFLEEYRFEAGGRDLSAIISALARLSQRDDFAGQLQRQLLIVSDDSFQHLCRHATPVNAHIAIDNATKTVRGGALWYEETLPPETLLVALISAVDARARDADMPAGDILSAVVTQLFGEHPYLQVGGNETVGMGWCAVQVVADGDAGSGER
jgi:CRISPR-associated protein Cmr4